MHGCSRREPTWARSVPPIGLEELQGQVGDGALAPIALPTPTSTSMINWATLGSTYSYAARATDRVGNATEWVTGPHLQALLTQQNSGSVSYSGTWTKANSTTASGGSLKYATKKGAAATFTFTGSGIAWVAYRGPDRGSVGIYIDDVFVKNISLYAKTYSSKQIAFAYNWTENARHTIKIVALGTAHHPRVDVDAFIRLTLS